MVRTEDELRANLCDRGLLGLGDRLEVLIALRLGAKRSNFLQGRMMHNLC